MSPHPLTSFEIQNYYQNGPKFNCVYSRKHLSEIKDGAFVINHDEYESIGTHWIVLNMNGNNIIHLDSFAVEYIPKESKKFIRS